MNDVNWYPYFKPDQVLTDQQLNQLTRYLLTQERLTRARTAGIGILCGLKVLPVSGGGFGIQIGSGIAITSAGYLVQHDATTYTHSRPFDNESAYPDFAPYISIRQLLTGAHATDTSVTELTATQLNEMVVLLFVEDMTVHPKACMKEHCDAEGSKQVITITPLLIHADDAQSVLEAQYNQTTKAFVLKTLNCPFDCSIPSIERIVESDLKTIVSPDKINTAYQKKISALFSNNATALDKLLSALWEGANALLKRSIWMNDDPQTSLTSTIVANHARNPFQTKPLFTFYEQAVKSKKTLQYYYDFIKKVLQAAKELRQSLINLSAACKPSLALFPQHIFLGKPTLSESVRHDFFRQEFISAPGSNDHKRLHQHASVLLERLSNMVTAFMVPANKLNELKITPGAGPDHPLGRQSVPFYLDMAKYPNLLTCWNPEHFADGRFDENYSWHAGKVYAKNIYTDHIKNSLKYSMDGFDFFRIEGHIGFKSQAVEQKIDSIIVQDNLPIAIKTLRLAPPADTGGKSLLDSMKKFVVDTPYKAQFSSMEYRKTSLEKTAPLIKLYTDQIKFSQADTISDDVMKQITYLPKPHFQDMVSLFNQIRMQCMCELSGILTTLGQMSVPSKTLSGALKPNMESDISFAGSKMAGAGPTIEEMYMEFNVSEVVDVHHFAKRYADMVEDAGTYIEVIEKPLTLLDALKKIYLYLGKDLFDFDFKGFSDVYKSAQIQAQDYLGLLRSGKIQQGFQQQIAIALYESITKLAFGCGMLQLQLFFDEVLRRTEQIRKNDLFKNYVKKHPGMEHSGGVPRGGTFVLIADTNDTIVADFSLPYICSSDLPPVTMSRPLIVFKLPILRFHTSDLTEYKFILSPPGGVVSGNGGIRYDTQSGDYFFTPSAEDVTPGDVTFTYTGDFGEKKLSATIGGIDATYTATEQSSNDPLKRYMIFNANMDKADAYVWDFGDGGSQKTGREVSRVFTVSETEPTTFDVRLEVSLGEHVEPDTQTIVFDPCTAQFTASILPSPLRLKLRQILVTAQEKKAESYTWFVNGSLIEKTDSPDFTHQIPAGARVITIGLTVAKGMCTIHNEKIVPTTACSAEFTTPFVDRYNKRKGVLVKADDKTADVYHWLVNGTDKHKLSGPESVYVPTEAQTAVEISLSVQKGDCTDGPVTKTVSFVSIIIGRDFIDTIEASRTRTAAMAESEAFGLVFKEDSGIYEKTTRVFDSISKNLSAAPGPEAYIKSNEYKTAIRSYDDLFKESNKTITAIRGRNAPAKQEVVAKLLSGQAEHFLTLVMADDKDVTPVGSTAKTMNMLIETVKESAARDHAGTLKKELAAAIDKSLGMAKDKPVMKQKLEDLNRALKR